MQLTGATIAVAAFIVMVIIAVLIAVISAVATASSIETRNDED